MHNVYKIEIVMVEIASQLNWKKYTAHVPVALIEEYLAVLCSCLNDCEIRRNVRNACIYGVYLFFSSKKYCASTWLNPIGCAQIAQAQWIMYVFCTS
jgi:hypothetical protein